MSRLFPVRSVRSRVLASVLAMSLLGMAVTGAVVYLIQYQLISTSITESLEQEVAEFRTLARIGTDPQTGRPFAEVAPLLSTAMLRNVPDRYETYLALVDGRPYQFDGGDRPVALESEPAVLAAVEAAAQSPDVVITDVTTSAGVVRLAIVPVSIEGASSTGTYVIAYGVDLTRAELGSLARIYTLASLVSLMVVGVVGWVVAGRLLQPLRTLSEATQRISETDLTERIPVRGNDDVSELTRTYNAMLDRLQTAIETQRRFFDDAGHELRTPLTILRGNLELLDPTDHADVSETREILLDEIDRMTRMVDDLILLSKAQRPDFLVLDDVDLATFSDDLMDKVRTLGDRQWILASRAETMIEADEQRLTQAMVELAHNAVKYSIPGSPIRVGSESRDAEVRLWVADVGTGIPAEEMDHIFERFRRVSTGRGVEGSGLGLSIVAAIAEAHGGHLEVASTLEVGSTFTLVLPRREPPQPPDADTLDDLLDTPPLIGTP